MTQQADRQPVSLEVTVRSGGEARACWIAEVAAREVLVVTDSPYPRHQLVALEILLPDATLIAVHGMVAALVEGRAVEGEEGGLTGMRVEFYGLVDWTRGAWEGFLASVGVRGGDVDAEAPGTGEPVAPGERKPAAQPLARITPVAAAARGPRPAPSRAVEEDEADDAEDSGLDLSLVIDVDSDELRAMLSDAPAEEPSPSPPERSLEIDLQTSDLPALGASAAGGPAEAVPAEPSLQVDVDSGEFRAATFAAAAEPSLQVDVDSGEFRAAAVADAAAEPSLQVDVDSGEFRAAAVVDAAAEPSPQVDVQGGEPPAPDGPPPGPPPWAREASVLVKDRGPAGQALDVARQGAGSRPEGAPGPGGAPPRPRPPAPPPWRPLDPAAPPPVSTGLAVYRLHLPNTTALEGFVAGPLSAGGIFVRTTDVRPVGTPAVVAVVHPASSDEFHMPGQVVDAGSGRPGVSVRFAQVTPRTVASFRHFVTAGFSPRGRRPSPQGQGPRAKPAPAAAPAAPPRPPRRQENTMEVALEDLAPLLGER